MVRSFDVNSSHLPGIRAEVQTPNDKTNSGEGGAKSSARDHFFGCAFGPVLYGVTRFCENSKILSAPLTSSSRSGSFVR